MTQAKPFPPPACIGLKELLIAVEEVKRVTLAVKLGEIEFVVVQRPITMATITVVVPGVTVTMALRAVATSLFHALDHDVVRLLLIV